jgi:hypothetical protein
VAPPALTTTKPYSLLEECICGYRMIQDVNSIHFLQEQQQIGFCNDEVQ